MIDLLGLAVKAKLSYAYTSPRDRQTLIYQIDKTFDYKVCVKCENNQDLASASEQDVARAIEAIEHALRGFAIENKWYVGPDIKKYRGTLKIWTNYIGNLHGECKNHRDEEADSITGKYNVIFIQGKEYREGSRARGDYMQIMDIVEGDQGNDLQHELGHMIGYGHPHPRDSAHSAPKIFANDIMLQNDASELPVVIHGTESHPFYMHSSLEYLRYGRLLVLFGNPMLLPNVINPR